MGILALAAMDKLIRKAGAKRVSESAKKAMRDVLEKYGEEIAAKAVMLAKHGGRTTVKEEDIKLALKT
ncbi:MAG: NFYB/HAP3 family transcription factor subunit [Nanoarchaeota archaeon]|nr:NFYB/HAP3 family transcription factor subunit [Nanoarchaeota archaeon]